MFTFWIQANPFSFWKSVVAHNTALLRALSGLPKQTEQDDNDTSLAERAEASKKPKSKEGRNHVPSSPEGRSRS